MIKYIILAVSLVTLACCHKGDKKERTSFYCTYDASDAKGHHPLICSDTRKGCNEVRVSIDPLVGKSVTTLCDYHSGVNYFHTEGNPEVAEVFTTHYECLRRHRYLKTTQEDVPITECAYAGYFETLHPADSLKTQAEESP